MERNAVLILEKPIFVFVLVKLAAILYSSIALLVTDIVE